MADNAPFEIMAGPISVYWAPVGESFPDVEDTPAGNWALIGTNGDRNQNEGGVTVTPSQETNEVRVAGSTGPVKSFRVSEELRVAFELLDMSMEHFRHTMNRNAVTTVAAGGGKAGWKRIDMYRGLDVDQHALLLRSSYSPYGASWNTQFQIPVVVQVGAPSLVFTKGDPLMVALEYLALEDPNASTEGERFGRLITQNAAIV